ncbi:DUF4242 domain-containing protein (plasmid) [Mesorhizobium sp. AR07]|uniref:DUF4242 domain-containing protein n=1 Tax=Mesorhizobium sp. AR07 TaxID=2865838 RepID=UPI00215F717A|nr:DUF4242 domain-containing protein [Mesorhizobium sp. AR07]UVK49441.1 DUF4242 domain-containing protein [Mesorhizobium sp. AR07]
MPYFVVERSFAQPYSDADLNADLVREKPCLEMYGVTWSRSVLAADRLRMICEYDAPDAESVRKAQRQAGKAFERVWPGNVLQ